MGRPGAGNCGEPPAIEKSLPDVGLPMGSASPTRHAETPRDNFYAEVEEDRRMANTPTSSRHVGKQPTWGVKLRPLKDVPSLPQDDKVEERRSSLVRQSTLAALEQKEMQTRENSPHPLDSIALNQAPLKPIEPIGNLGELNPVGAGLNKRLPKLESDR